MFRAQTRLFLSHTRVRGVSPPAGNTNSDHQFLSRNNYNSKTYLNKHINIKKKHLRIILLAVWLKNIIRLTEALPRLRLFLLGAALGEGPRDVTSVAGAAGRNDAGTFHSVIIYVIQCVNVIILVYAHWECFILVI